MGDIYKVTKAFYNNKGTRRFNVGEYFILEIKNVGPANAALLRTIGLVTTEDGPDYRYHVTHLTKPGVTRVFPNQKTFDNRKAELVEKNEIPSHFTLLIEENTLRTIGYRNG